MNAPAPSTPFLQQDPVYARWASVLATATTQRQSLEALLWLGHRCVGIENSLAETYNEWAHILVEALNDDRGRAFLFLNRLETVAFAFDLDRFADQWTALLQAEEWARTSGDRGLHQNLVHYRALFLGAGPGGSLLEAGALIDGIVTEFESQPAQTPMEWEALAGSYTMLAMGVQRGNDTEGAIRLYRLACDALENLELHTGYPISLLLLVNLLLDAGQTDEAEKELARLEGARKAMPSSMLPEPLFELQKLRLASLRDNGPEVRQALNGYLAQLLPFVDQSAAVFGIEFVLLLAEVSSTTGDLALFQSYADLCKARIQGEFVSNDLYKPRYLRLRAELAGQTGDLLEQIRLLKESALVEHRSQTGQLSQQRERLKLTREIEAQFQQTVRLKAVLESFLPKPIVQELVDQGSSSPRQVPRAALLVGDIAGFSTTVAAMSADDVFQELTRLFSAFDEKVQAAGGQRLKTIGDAYFAVSGLLDANPDPVQVLAKSFIDLQEVLARQPVFRHMRFGLAFGPVTAGIVGSKQYLFDVLGHTVNLAFRLEAASDQDCLLMDAASASELQKTGFSTKGWVLRPAGLQALKGVGEVETWALVREART